MPVALLLASSGCAILNRDNTPTLNFLEKELVPQSKPARMATMPLVFPVGVLAVVADAFIVHPATVVDDAAEDVYDAFWDHWRWNDRYMSECAALPWKAVLTPPFFLGDFLGRAMFDVSQTAEKQRRKEALDKARAEATTQIQKARQLLANNKASEAVNELLAINQYQMEAPERLEMVRMLMQAGAQSSRFEAWDSIPDMDDESQNQLAPLITEAQKSPDPYARLHAFRLAMRFWRKSIPPILQKQSEAPPAPQAEAREPPQMRIVRTMLADPHPAIRLEALGRMRQLLQMGNNSWEAAYVAVAAEVAEKDADPLVRATAKQMQRIAQNRKNWKTQPHEPY